ncbi:hypothetical protein BgiMline_009611 [Biomphalaria glabrata]
MSFCLNIVQTPYGSASIWFSLDVVQPRCRSATAQPIEKERDRGINEKERKARKEEKKRERKKKMRKEEEKDREQDKEIRDREQDKEIRDRDRKTKRDENIKQ